MNFFECLAVTSYAGYDVMRAMIPEKKIVGGPSWRLKAIVKIIQ